ncbi:papilin-like isoform X5 [Siphateles boraxobius]|uniref:papilin-like isoform X5 n=1 Tax=Siphateles boraxobius TaxID=180520 RepID=UPI004063EFE2
MPMWAFDSAAGKCVSFIYGGCMGNGNKFNSQKECEESCGVRNAACGLPIHAGPCFAYIPMWAFDSAAGKCVPFIYGGCMGNGNRFNSQKECEKSCGVRNVKPGVCPSRKYGPGMCALIRFVSCANDTDCANNEKCCSNGCGLQCMAPVTAAKPGVCPSRKYEPGKCVLIRFVSCANDTDCANNEKCCSNGCGLQCMAALTAAKPGVCPVRYYKKPKCNELCANDNDCPNNEKCCSTECGLQCMAPITAACRLPIDAGPCQAYMPMWAFDSAAGKCVSFIYGGCKGNGNKFNSQKECEESCGVRSAACGLPMDTGPCKVYIPMWAFDSAAGKCVSFIYGGCMGNGNRFNSKKECEKLCGVRNVKPGVCPSRKYEPGMCALIRFVSCANDTDCANNEKCCSNGCGLQCMASVTVKPGVCPRRKYKPGMCARIRFVSCTDDSDCANNEKCCSNGCGLQCMAPLTVKPGLCPRTNYEEVRCIMKGKELCADDSECPKNLKCCSTACGGRQCMAPVTVKPGVCPSTKYKAEECAWIRFVSCADDSDCVKNEKCCSNGCGLQCMAPVSVKPGVCPSTKYEAEECAWIRFMSCADDSDCAKNEKCCSNGCGLQCMAPATVKPGECPRTNYEEIMCIMKGKKLCVDDSECPKNQKCCSTACGGRQCMAPVTVKPGVCPSHEEMMICMNEEFCADDSECPGQEKCCSNACGGHQCTAPFTG